MHEGVGGAARATSGLAFLNNPSQGLRYCRIKTLASRSSLSQPEDVGGGDAFQRIARIDNQRRPIAS